MVLIKVGPRAKPGRREVTRRVPAPRPGPLGVLTLEIQVAHARLLPSPRLAGLLLTEGPPGRTGSHHAVGTLGRSDENQKAARKQPQKAFTSNALKPHNARTRGHPNASTKNSKHCRTDAEKTWGEKIKPEPSQGQLESFITPPLLPAAVGRAGMQWRRETTLV